MSRKIEISVAMIFVVIAVTVMQVGVITEDQAYEAPDFASIENVQERKDAFFDYLRPIVEEINLERSQERQQLNAMYSDLVAGKTISKRDRRKLRSWAQRYGITIQNKNLLASVKTLRMHLDEIPPSMVLAQAAIESAWGTSRFVLLGNNYFGQWCYRKGCGVVPSARQKGSKHEVRKFSSTRKSVYAYFKNINSHAVYKQLRNIRAQSRAAGEPLSGLKMVAGLKKYSQRGQDYIDELRSVIRFNNLE